MTIPNFPPRYDAHQHFWRYDPVAHGWMNGRMTGIQRDFLPTDLAPLLAAQGFAGCVAVQASQTLGETRWLLELADRHSFIRGVVGWVDLRSPDVRDQLAQFARHPRLKGVRHVVQDEPDVDFMRGAEFQRGIAALQEFGLTYDLLLFPKHLPVAVDLVRRFPALTFVVDHLAKPLIAQEVLEPWASDLKALAALPNVTCKLSGLVTEADWVTWTPAHLEPYLDEALAAFGPQRLMIGSDWPVCILAGSYGRVMDAVQAWVARLGEADRNAILGGNCARVYKL